MGVNKLWVVLRPAARTVRLESLKHRRLAIDASIWLTSFVKAMRDSSGNTIHNAHLKGLWARLCKLLFLGLKPVFVFDGTPPLLKSETLLARRRARARAQDELSKIAERILLNQLKISSISQAKQLLKSGKLTLQEAVKLGGLVTKGDASVDALTQNQNATEEENGTAAKPVDISDLESSLSELDRSGHLEGTEAQLFVNQFTDEDLRRLVADESFVQELPRETQLALLMQMKAAHQGHVGLISLASPQKISGHNYSSLQMEQLVHRGSISRRLESVRSEIDNQSYKPIASDPKVKYRMVSTTSTPIKSLLDAGDEEVESSGEYLNRSLALSTPTRVSIGPQGTLYSPQPTATSSILSSSSVFGEDTSSTSAPVQDLSLAFREAARTTLAPIQKPSSQYHPSRKPIRTRSSLPLLSIGVTDPELQLIELISDEEDDEDDLDEGDFAFGSPAGSSLSRPASSRVEAYKYDQEDVNFGIALDFDSSGEVTGLIDSDEVVADPDEEFADVEFEDVVELNGVNEDQEERMDVSEEQIQHADAGSSTETHFEALENRPGAGLARLAFAQRIGGNGEEWQTRCRMFGGAEEMIRGVDEEAPEVDLGRSALFRHVDDDVSRRVEDGATETLSVYSVEDLEQEGVGVERDELSGDKKGETGDCKFEPPKAGSSRDTHLRTSPSASVATKHTLHQLKDHVETHTVDHSAKQHFTDPPDPFATPETDTELLEAARNGASFGGTVARHPHKETLPPSAPRSFCLESRPPTLPAHPSSCGTSSDLLPSTPQGQRHPDQTSPTPESAPLSFASTSAGPQASSPHPSAYQHHMIEKDTLTSSRADSHASQALNTAVISNTRNGNRRRDGFAASPTSSAHSPPPLDAHEHDNLITVTSTNSNPEPPSHDATDAHATHRGNDKIVTNSRVFSPPSTPTDPTNPSNKQISATHISIYDDDDLPLPVNSQRPDLHLPPEESVVSASTSTIDLENPTPCTSVSEKISSQHQLSQTRVVDLDISTESQQLPSVNQSTVSEESERERLQGLLSFENLEAELRREVIALEGVARTEQHHAATLTSEAVDEAKELLKLFGIPYVQSPSEADAQCAVLQTLGLVDGIVSDDSDILVFGGDTVFRYAFSSQHELELYNMEDIQTELGLDHDSLIFLAFLLGGDYADGISKVGPRAGLDIVNAFPGPDGMLKFKAWLEAFQAGSEDYGMVLDPPSAEFIKRHGKLAMGMKLPPSFPNASVMDAYTNPKVDSSSEPFSWGWPDLSGLRQFATDKFGWTMDRIDSNLLPIIQKYTAALSDKQPKIETFFTHASIHGRKLPTKSPKKNATGTREATGSLSGGGDAESEGQPTSLAPHRGSPSLSSGSVETPARSVSSRAQAKNSKKRKRAAGTSPLKPVLEAEREASDDEYLEPAPQIKRGKRK